MEKDASGAILRRYVHGPGMDAPIVWYEGAATTDRRWLHADERGSIIAVTDSTGVPITNGINRYDEYGIPLSTNQGRFQYTGQAWLPELGLYYYKARMYSPTLGRFMQTDPIGYADGMNMYAYVGGDPVNGRDPSGLLVLDLECASGNCINVTAQRPRPPDFGSSALPWPTGISDMLNQISADYSKLAEYWAAKEPQSGHYYKYTARVCTAAPDKPCHIDRTNRAICVLPGHISTDAIQSGDWYAVYSNIGDLIPTGIVTTETAGQYSYRNTTTWLHPLSGTIDRIFSQDSRGNINVTTIGQGTAATTLQDSVNQKRGPGIFHQQDELCSAILGGG